MIRAMNRSLFGCLLTLVLSLPAVAALKEGDRAPDFEAPAAVAGKPFNFSLREALKKGPVVIYFYPAAYTNVCNVQTHQFASNYEKFVAAGATVVGVSMDSIDKLKSFSAEPNYCGGKVAVASDADGSIARAYDLDVKAAPPGATDTLGLPIEHGLVEEYIFVVAPDGRVSMAMAENSPVANVNKALEAVRRLSGRQITRGWGTGYRMGRNTPAVSP